MAGDNGFIRLKDNGKSKGTGIIAAAVILLLAVAAAVVFMVMSGNSPSVTDKQTTAPTTLPTVTQPPATLPPTTVPPTTQPVPVTEPPVTLSGDCLAFASDCYYLEGTLYTQNQGSGTYVSIASNNGASQITGQYRTMWLAVINTESGKYLADTESRSYIDWSDEALASLQTTEIPYDIVLPGKIDSLTYAKADVSLNGDKAVCYSASTSDRIYQLYDVDGTIKQAAVFDSDGKCLYDIIVDEFYSYVPNDQINLNSLAKSTSMFSFFSAIIH